MKKLLLVCLIALSIAGCQKKDTAFAGDYEEGTAHAQLASYIDLLNSGKFEESLKLFTKDPVTAGEISMEEYKEFMTSRLFSGGKITDLTLKSTEKDDSSESVTLIVTDADGNTFEKWVMLVKTDGQWKMTMRGSLF